VICRKNIVKPKHPTNFFRYPTLTKSTGTWRIPANYVWFHDASQM
jgi:hypothetical protein